MFLDTARPEQVNRPDSSRGNEEHLCKARETTRAASPQLLTGAHHGQHRLDCYSGGKNPPPPHLDPGASAATTFPPRHQPRLPTAATTPLLPPGPAAPAAAASSPHARGSRDHPGRHGSDRQPLEHATRSREHTRWALARGGQSHRAQGPRRAESVWGRSRACRRSSRECRRAWRSGCGRTRRSRGTTSGCRGRGVWRGRRRSWWRWRRSEGPPAAD